MHMLMERMADPHFKVVIASLECVMELLPPYRVHLEHLLERLLPKLIINLFHNKQQVKDLSSNLLEVVADNFACEALLPVLFKVRFLQTSLFFFVLSSNSPSLFFRSWTTRTQRCDLAPSSTCCTS